MPFYSTAPVCLVFSYYSRTRNVARPRKAKMRKKKTPQIIKKKAEALRKEVWAWSKPEFKVRTIPTEYAQASKVDHWHDTKEISVRQ